MDSYALYLSEASAPVVADIKNEVLNKLLELNPDEKIFKEISSLLFKYSGEDDWFTNTIKVFKGRGDPDIDKLITNFFVGLIDTIGFKETNYKGVSEFLTKFASGKEFIKMKDLVPDGGMTTYKSISDLWKADKSNSPELIAFLDSLYSRSFGAKVSKSDAGPGEIFLAVISRKITFPPKIATSDDEIGGDIVVAGRKIEVKGGGARIFDNKAFPFSLTTKEKISLLGYFSSIIKANGVAGLDAAPFTENKKYNSGDMFIFNERIFQVVRGGSVTKKELMENLPPDPTKIRTKKTKPQPYVVLFDKKYTSPNSINNPKNIKFSFEYLGAFKEQSETMLSVLQISNSTLSINRNDPKFISNMKAVSLGIFDKDYSKILVKYFATPEFSNIWTELFFNQYKEVKHWEGILYIKDKPDIYKYIVTPDQLAGSLVTPGIFLKTIIPATGNREFAPKFKM